MKKYTIIIGALAVAMLAAHCAGESGAEPAEAATPNYAGFESQVKWGEHLVTVGGCHDCHTPKKFTAAGMILDSSRFLMGQPADQPLPDVNRKDVESKMLVTTQNLTEWFGPWGISFAANLTPDPTGTGSWTEDQFIYALRNGKYKGLPESRSILPPMPWEMIRHMTDDELKAIFAYLRTVPPINNVVPAPVPPMGAM